MNASASRRPRTRTRWAPLCNGSGGGGPRPVRASGVIKTVPESAATGGPAADAAAAAAAGSFAKAPPLTVTAFPVCALLNNIQRGSNGSGRQRTRRPAHINHSRPSPPLGLLEPVVPAPYATPSSRVSYFCDLFCEHGEFNGKNDTGVFFSSYFHTF